MSLASVLNCRGVVNRFSAILVANVVLVSSARRFKNNSLLLKQQGYLYYIMFIYAYNILLISTTLQRSSTAIPNPGIRTALYKTLVRSQLVYCSQIWFATVNQTNSGHRENPATCNKAYLVLTVSNKCHI